jgi:preprotein translocase subunit SecG
MFSVLLVVHVILTVAMIGIILVQRSASDGLGGIGGGGGSGLMTSRSQANLLTRTTAILATLFIVNSLALSWITQRDIKDSSIANKIIEEKIAAPEVPTPDSVKAPEVAAPVKDANPAEAAPKAEPKADEVTEKKTTTPKSGK